MAGSQKVQVSVTMEVSGIERIRMGDGQDVMKLLLRQHHSVNPFDSFLYVPWDDATAAKTRIGDRLTLEVWHEGSTTFESATEPVNAGTAVRGERSPVLGETMVDKLSAHVGRVQSRYDDARPSRIDLIPDTEDGRG